MVDSTAENLLADIEIIDKELVDFSPELPKKEQIIVLNKIDLLIPEEIENIKKSLKEKFPQRTIMSISGLAQLGTIELMNFLKQRISAIRESAIKLDVSAEDSASEKQQKTWIADDKATARPDKGFQVSQHKDLFYVEGDRLVKHSLVVDYKSPESIQHFCHILRSMGVIDELYKRNIQVGDSVQIGQMTFTFGENLY
jgi:GTP-binding protein